MRRLSLIPRLATVFLATLCLFISQVPSASGEVAKPFYTIKVTEASPLAGTVETPLGVSSSFRVKKVSGLGTAYSGDATIKVTVSEAVDYTWKPKEYYAKKVTDDVGTSLGSAHDTQSLDETYYKISAHNQTQDEWVTDFTFTIPVPSADIGDANDIYVMLSGISPVSAKIRMYDGTVWKTIRTAELDEGEMVEFPVGKEYIQSGEVKVRIYTLDDSDYDVKIDYVAMKFKPAKMTAVYTIPEGGELVGVRKCCTGSTEVAHTVSGRAVSVDLSDYIDFENRYYSIEYSYSYDIKISDYAILQKTPLSLSASEPPQTEIEYQQSFSVSMPYPHRIKIEAEPTMSAITLRDLHVSDKSRTIKSERDTQKFEMEGGGTVKLTYNLKGAYSFKAEYVYNQTSYSLTRPAWSSRYSIRRGYDIELANVSIRHDLIGDLNMTSVEVKPSVDWEKVMDGKTMYVAFRSLKSDVLVSVYEGTAGLSANYTPAVQENATFSVGTSPVFRVDVSLLNPSERPVAYTISREDIFLLLPDLKKKYPDLAASSFTPVATDLNSGESVLIPLYFNSSPVAFSEEGPTQEPAVINQQVQWRKVIRLSNPGPIRYENVSWKTAVSFEALDYTLDGGTAGTLDAGSFSYTEPAMEPGQKVEHVLLYSTAPVRKTEEVVSSGLIEKKIEKRITLVNNNEDAVTFQSYSGIGDVPNLDEAAMAEALGAYTLSDKDGDGVNDLVKWKETLRPGENKTIILYGKALAPLSMETLGSLAGSIDATLLIALLLTALTVFIVSLALVVRYVRRERRRRVYMFISSLETAMKGGQVPAAAQKK